MAHAQAKAQRMKTTVAKSNGQSLFEHTLAVARYAASLCTDRRLRRILIQAAWYHDMGKLARGFQQMMQGEAHCHYRHEILSALTFLAEHPDLDEQQEQILYAILTHHRDIDDGEMLRQLCNESLLQERITELPPDVFPSAPVLLSCARRLLERILDRDRQYPLLSEHTLTRGLLIAADHAASAGLTRAVIVEREYHRQGLRRFQQEASATEGNLVLEAPTGAGKTDAALLWYQRNRRHAGERLFYVLPYRASIEAMRDRLEGIYGKESVAALHGRDLEYAYARYLNDTGSEQALQCAREDVNANRLVHKPIKVLTPQQILKYLLGIRRFEVGVAEMKDALFVFDEIHAYDVHTLALVLETVKFLLQLGARVLVMTATMPDFVRALIENSLGKPARISAYGDPELPVHRHRLKVLAQPLEACASLVRRDLAEGKSVLVVCNRVAQAQALYRQFDDVSSRVLLHSRFTYKDRERLERAVRDRRNRPQLLIATQVVEVSLDISYDTCYTEVAPVDDLLQRFGRVNREGKQPEPAVVHVCTEYDTNTVQHVYDRQRLRQTAQTAPDGEVLTHEVTTRWLNDVYQRFTDAEQERFEKVSTLFRIHIQQLQPYHSVRITEKALDKLYNTVDAVPQSFADEYRTLLDGGRWLDARMLLVPVAVTDRRLSSMRSGDYLINRPYDEELGLL